MQQVKSDFTEDLHWPEFCQRLKTSSSAESDALGQAFTSEDTAFAFNGKCRLEIDSCSNGDPRREYSDRHSGIFKNDKDFDIVDIHRPTERTFSNLKWPVARPFTCCRRSPRNSRWAPARLHPLFRNELLQLSTMRLDSNISLSVVFK